MLSKRALALKPSPTLAMATKARELQAQGNDVVSLTVGEPDWATFPAACEAGIQAIQQNFTKYTAVAGIPELRTAISQQISEQTQVSYKASNVCVGSGAKFVIFSALQMICNEGDEVLIPSPYWVSYPVMVELAGGKPVIIECGEKENFKLTPDLLRRSLTVKTKAFILCSPSNPTGLIYTAQELKALARVLMDFPQVVVISDDIYNRLIFTGDSVAPHLLHAEPSLQSRCLVINGASKAYSMTGWRIGWAAGPEKLIQVMTDYMSQSTSSASSLSQKAALAAIQKCEPDLQKANRELLTRKDWFLQKMSDIPGFQVIPPQGAFYFWVKVSDFFGKTGIKNSKDVAERLLDKHFVATVPGVEFGAEGYLRLSFATSLPQLEKAVNRFHEFSKSNLG